MQTYRRLRLVLHTDIAVAVGLIAVAATGAAYVAIADRTGHPLGVLVIPVLAVAALTTWRRTAVVGVASIATAALVGSIESGLDTLSLVARLAIVTVGAGLGVSLAEQRERRQHAIDLARSRALLIDAFQSSLAPQPVPPRWATIDTRYIPGDDRLQFGGDFFDAIELPDGALGYIIGDVCGNGARAAAFGAAIRAGWKTVANADPTDPSAWVAVMQASFFRYGRHEGYVTLNTGRIDLERGAVRFVSAGHPWPVLLGETVHQITPEHVSPPIGVDAESRFCSSSLHLPAGSTLLLFTDGLYENRTSGVRRGDGEWLLVEHLRAEGRADLDALLERFGPDGFEDDVALMTISLDAGATGSGGPPTGVDGVS